VCKGDTTVKFTRRVKNSFIFIGPQTEAICKIKTENIVAFLPEPIKTRRGGMIFPV
jgi:hypothetical protein